MIRRQLLVSLAVTLGITAVLLVSPLLLIAVQWIYPVDWQILSLIGQSYSGVAALLSFLALIAVAWSIYLQSRQAEVARMEGSIQMHMTLWGMAISDRRLGSVFKAQSTDFSHDDYSQAAFMAMVFRYMHYSFASGLIDEHALRVQLREDFFAYEAFRERWKRSSEGWKEENVANEREFVRIADEEHERATTRAATPNNAGRSAPLDEYDTST